MIALLAAWVLFPAQEPSPSPLPSPPPVYVTESDGSRWQCSPTGDSCREDSSGLPSYLVP